MAVLVVGEILNVRFGSVTVIQTHSSRMAALGRKAAIRPGCMSAFTQTGRSETLKWPDLNVSLRPIADIC